MKVNHIHWLVAAGLLAAGCASSSRTNLVSSGEIQSRAANSDSVVVAAPFCGVVTVAGCAVTAACAGDEPPFAGSAGAVGATTVPLMDFFCFEPIV